MIIASWCDSFPKFRVEVLKNSKQISRLIHSDVQNISNFFDQNFGIRRSNIYQLCLLLLCISKLKPGESVGCHINSFLDSMFVKEQKAAFYVLQGISPDISSNIIKPSYLLHFLESNPYFLKSLGSLFELALFPHSAHNQKVQDDVSPLNDFAILSPLIHAQICFFLPKSVWQVNGLTSLFRASFHGYSMYALERKMCNYHNPSILLIKAKKINANHKSSSRPISLDATIPRKYPPHCIGTDKAVPQKFGADFHNENILLGAYISTRWRQSHMGFFGDHSTLLFQLQPIHQVYYASNLDKNYCMFDKNVGLGFGLSRHKVTNKVQYDVPGVCMYIDDGLEYGLFRHAGDGAFKPATNYENFEYEERFLIQDLEVIGVDTTKPVEPIHIGL